MRSQVTIDMLQARITETVILLNAHRTTVSQPIDDQDDEPFVAMPNMKLFVTGARTATDPNILEAAIAGAEWRNHVDEIHTAGGPGAEQLAEQWAIDNDKHLVTHTEIGATIPQMLTDCDAVVVLNDHPEVSSGSTLWEAVVHYAEHLDIPVIDHSV